MIRRAEVTDAAAIAALEVAFPERERWSERTWAGELAASDRAGFVALAAAEITRSGYVPRPGTPRLGDGLPRMGDSGGDSLAWVGDVVDDWITRSGDETEADVPRSGDPPVTSRGGSVGHSGQDATLEPLIVGAALVQATCDMADLHRVVVTPHARRCGIARSLLDAGTSWAASRGATRMLLEVRPDNAAALGLYEGDGFGVIATRTDYYAPGVDCLVMEKPLARLAGAGGMR